MCNKLLKLLDFINKLTMQAHLVSAGNGTALFPMPRVRLLNFILNLFHSLAVLLELFFAYYAV
jgi:hypothetical protein